MELNKRTLLISIGLGVGVWIFDAAVDSLFMYDGGFLSVLLFDVPLSEVYVRLATVLAFLGVSVLISRQTDKLRNSKQDLRLFRTLLDNANDGIYVIEPSTTRFLDVNETACEMLGYSRDELLEMDITAIKDQFDEPGDFVSFTQSPEGETLRAYETVHVTKEGTRLPVEISASHVAIDDVEYRVAIARDLSSRQRLETELQAEHMRYESLFDSIRDTILVADSRRRITNCNKAFTELFGYELSEIEGEPTELIYAEDEGFSDMGDEISTHLGDPSFTHTILYETKTGRKFPGETNVSYLHTPDGEVVGYIGLIRDVSDREDRITQMQVIDHVLRHNIRNDLNVIQGYAELIQSESPDSDSEYAGKILTTSEKLLTTVSKEREITTLLSQDHPTKPIDVTELVTLTIADVRERYPNANITVAQLEEGRATAIDALPRALTELLTNALRHSNSETPSVELEVVADTSFVEISIADDGPGIPEMDRDVLTGEADMDQLYHASGLGLWVVKLIVQQSGGSLSFEENDPQGTVVTMRLPSAT